MDADLTDIFGDHRNCLLKAKSYLFSWEFFVVVVSFFHDYLVLYYFTNLCVFLFI